MAAADELFDGDMFPGRRVKNAGAGGDAPVADEVAAALRRLIADSGQHFTVRLPGVDHGLELRLRQRAGIDQLLRQRQLVGGLRRLDRRHRGRLNERARVRLGAFDARHLRPVRLVDRRGELRVFGIRDRLFVGDDGGRRV